MTKFLNISTDNTLGGNSASDEVVSSQKALKTYIDNHSGGGSVVIDNLSITKNGDNELQTIGVINQNSTTTAIKTWTGTKAQYDAIVSKDDNTLYNITDDANPTLSLLESIYPVGSVYIGTMSVCPLSALFGTWTLVSTKILTDIPATLEAKGNGMALGFDTGITSPAGYEHVGLRIGDGDYSSALVATNGNYGATVGSATTGSGTAKGLVGGITTDATKSGIVADKNATALTVNVWERTA